MSTMIQNNVRYPAWTKVWNESAGAIEAQILDCYHSLEYKAAQGDGEEQCRLVKNRVRDWFDQQPLEPEAALEFEQIKDDPAFLKEKVNDRIRQLMEEGRFGLEAMTHEPV